MKYAILIVLDLDVTVLDSTKSSEVEKITESRVRTALERASIEIRMLRTKLMGKTEEKK